MSEVKRFDEYTCGVTEAEDGEYVKHSDYAKLADEAQALREEVARAEQHRNDQADLIVSLRTEVAALRMARDDLKLERDLARQNFCDEQAANYQLQAHLKACLGELSELRARVVVVPERLTNGDSISRMLREIGCDGDVSYHHAREIWNACIDELSRINGKVVSEGLLREARRHLGNWLELHECECEGGFHYCGREQVAKTHRELRSLLNQDKENGNG
ncbi:hypothetical protein DZA07_05000 [Pseudomonas aeruginosa]|uniref:hypothetical protein n=1 Tax=Pseudomonas aeruginosa TaxID=287 RepID=UPI000F8194F3|nr:hypothetical protein [Pseudomonas aeruginosa]RTW83309.1 hypothetical protein DZA07_05000 [Pseudomonas aeruginosa]